MEEEKTLHQNEGHEVIVIESIALKNLPNVEWWFLKLLSSKQDTDPYVKVGIVRDNGDVEEPYKTAVRKQNPNPVWRPSFVFEIDSRSKATITFAIHHDSINDSSVGSFSVALSDIFPNGFEESERKLQGTITLAPSVEPRNEQPATYELSIVGVKYDALYGKQTPTQMNAEVPDTLTERVAVGSLSHWENLYFVSMRDGILKQINLFSGAAVKPPKGDPKPQLYVPLWKGESNIKWQILQEDEAVPLPSAAKLVDYINKLPFRDANTPFENASSGEAWLKTYQFDQITAIPAEGYWIDRGISLTTDEGTSRFFFYNNGSLWMEKTPTGYKCCFEWLSDRSIKYRPGYDTYGGDIFFHEDQSIEKIVIRGKTFTPPAPNETDEEVWREWSYAKLKVRSSCLIISAVYHLMRGHNQWANYPNAAIRTYLPSTHPIRIFLTPFFYRSALLGRKSLSSLIKPNGLLPRGVTLTLDSMWQLYRHAMETLYFEPYPDELERRGLKDIKQEHGEIFPAAKDGLEYYNIVRRFVENFVKLPHIYPTEDKLLADTAMKNVWDYISERLPKFPPFTLEGVITGISEIVFRVSGWHKHAGNVANSVSNPSFHNLRLKGKEHLCAPVEAALVVGLIGASTSLKMPTVLSDKDIWIEFFQHDEEKAVYKQWIKDLEEQSAIIEERNTKRLQPFTDYDPKHVTCSVSS